MSLIARKVLATLAIVAFVAGYLMLGFATIMPKSGLGWLALFALGVPAWFALEWLGGVVLGWGFLARRSSAVRILLAVPLVIGLMGIWFGLARVVRWGASL